MLNIKPTNWNWLPETILEQATLDSQIYCKAGQQASLEYTCISTLPQGWCAPECLLPHRRRCGSECPLHRMRNRQSRVCFPIWENEEASGNITLLVPTRTCTPKIHKLLSSKFVLWFFFCLVMVCFVLLYFVLLCAVFVWFGLAWLVFLPGQHQ